MPELPEVETVRRGLEPTMVGARFAKVETRRGDLRTPFPPRFAERLKGRRVVSLTRRAKYLLAALDSGETLVMHLGMSGSFRVERGGAAVVPTVHHERPKRSAHDHVVFDLDNGARVVFNDPRRFGAMDLVKSEGIAERPPFDALGVEPLSAKFDAVKLATLFAGARAPIKTAFSTRSASRASATSTSARRCTARASARPARRESSPTPRASRPPPRARCRRRSAPCSRRRSKPAARRCATTASPTASSAISSTPSPSTTAKAPPARAAAAAAPSRASPRADGRRSIVRRASGRRATRRGEAIQATAASERASRFAAGPAQPFIDCLAAIVRAAQRVADIWAPLASS